MFRYLADPLFLLCCGLYVLNRWLLKPHLHSVFLRSWFDDLLLVPCAIPVLLWIFRRLHLRQMDDPPKLLELAWILLVWSLLFEWIGPRFVSRATADWRDVLMYWAGGMIAWIVWHAQLRPNFVDEL
jgi:hypothetical protein